MAMLPVHERSGTGCHNQPQEEATVNRNPGTDATQPMVYQIRLKGHLGPQWKEWFGGVTITLEENDDTLLSGQVVDQAALHGLLKKVRDLGTPLISVIRIRPGQGDATNVKQ
jgi:hypothetical protein